MKVDENRIYYPLQPRLISITQPLFSQLDRDKKVVAELKYNGDHLILKRLKTGKFEFWTRHGEPFKRYTPPPGLIRELNELSWQGPPLPQSISNPIPHGETISRNPSS
jgi:hypothetical protein